MQNKLLSIINNRLHLLETKNLYNYHRKSHHETRKKIFAIMHKYEGQILQECEFTKQKILSLINNDKLTNNWTSDTIEKSFPSNKLPDKIYDPINKEWYEIDLGKDFRLEEKTRIEEESNFYFDSLTQYQAQVLHEVRFELKEMLKIVQEIENIANNNDSTTIIQNAGETNKTDTHDEMFAKNGFILFNFLLEKKYIKPKEVRGYQTDLIYFYWRLFDDGFIRHRPSRFLDWYNKEYEDENSQFKTIEQTYSQSRFNNYTTALDWFNRNNLFVP